MDKRSSLMEILGADLPIVQAPIGSAATVDLVAEVGRAGGIGGLALTWTKQATAIAQVRALKERLGRRFFVNYVLRFPLISLEAVLAEGVPAITLSWGADADLVARIKSTGARVGVQVGHPLGAKRAKDAGVDFIIAQGYEAGGHVQSTMPLMTLLAGVREVAEGLPVVAAGGLSTAACVAHALKAGAAAAMLGTRFLATTEADAHASYKLAILHAQAADTAFTNCFDIGWPYATVRVLRNSTFDSWEAAGCPMAPDRPGEGDTVAHQRGAAVVRYSDAPPLADATGDPLAACLYAGTSVDGIEDIVPAFELVRRLRPTN
ncbi:MULTISPECIES: nitronate monooxygenase [unclassified Bradyrhizobium]|uniref:NAD(P)H-dependent flavin oxidoreductase n=1 Tax=unclassified Bradyrhizobium TaxID=2631580 RepID=UPI0028EBF567|nr:MULTISPECIES: nitronate monooxygenase [unclassified Bradyrhizobium]